MGIKEKDLKMVWQVEKKGLRSLVVGTAHFFPYSFRSSIARLVSTAETVLFEGPLDDENSSKVVAAGRTDEHYCLLDELPEKTLVRIAENLFPAGMKRISSLVLYPLASAPHKMAFDMIRGMKPWLAFFVIWKEFLETRGWRCSVDQEGYRAALELGKTVVPLESIEEQIQVLESLSHEKIINFLENTGKWDLYAKRFAEAYLAADLTTMRQIAKHFPSRHPAVIDTRDRIFFERMQDDIERGSSVAFLGAPHMPGVLGLLREHGFVVTGPDVGN